ncbi:MAG: FG-GAP-like repeat-containing protein [Nitrospirota bacterium]|nr:FG-GAP-like repeat-containing protein [Nitrospirota bacterium]
MKKLLIVCLTFCFLTAFTINRDLDNQLALLIQENKLHLSPIADLYPSEDNPELAALGGALFFSPDLSIDGSVSCASCHHPEKAGADGIALPIGIGGGASTNIGQDRLATARATNPDLALNGQIPRNSPTVMNSSFYQQRIFWDGRVQYVSNQLNPGERHIQAGIYGAGQYNPSNYSHHNLLQTQARMPLSSAFEMKGGLQPNKNNHEIEQAILHFLQSSPEWCKQFAQAYGGEDCHHNITLDHLTQALAEFQATMVLTNSPFDRYVKGDEKALTSEHKLGAISFLTGIENGGAGCVNCHSGRHFTNEHFYNINIPASGSGANGNGWDFGRNNVDKNAARFSFRVPSLLNVALTAPYFHNGVALTLEDAIKYHVTDPDLVRKSVGIPVNGVDFSDINPVIHDAFNGDPDVVKLLPRKLSNREIVHLVAFMESLTDPCLLDQTCYGKFIRPIIETPRPEVTLRDIPARFIQRDMQQGPATQPDVRCKMPLTKGADDPQARFYFTQHNSDLGINHVRELGLIKKGWLVDVMNYSGVAVMDVNYDCLDDIIFDAGSHGFIFYLQDSSGRLNKQTLSYSASVGDLNPLIMDLDGDYRFDLFVGNLGEGHASFVFDFLLGADDRLNMQALHGPVINASIADINANGYMDVAFAFWRSFNSVKQPHIWFNDAKGNLTPEDGYLSLRQSERNVDGGDYVLRMSPRWLGAPDLTLTPNFVDMDNDGDPDLLLAADFLRSQVLKNDIGKFEDITDKNVINDSNGMGVAIGDFHNNGRLDWFVTSIVDQSLKWVDGHKLYVNQGKGVFSQQAVPNKGNEWSWGACAADFNNDGYQDIFYISGYAENRKTAVYESKEQESASEMWFKFLTKFSNSSPTLLINDTKGNFTDQSARYGFTAPLDGRGIGCFDYQQDGDIDIVVNPLEGMPVLFKNHLDGMKNWLAIRLIGLPGNTEALGTKVTLYTSLGKQYREVRFENNYISRNPAQLHFGLGDLDKIEKLVIELPLPNKKHIVIDELPINQLHILRVGDLLRMDSTYDQMK